MPSKANTAVPKKSGYFFQPATIGRLWGSGIFWKKKQKNNTLHLYLFYRILNETAKSYNSELHNSK